MKRRGFLKLFLASTFFIWMPKDHKQFVVKRGWILNNEDN